MPLAHILFYLLFQGTSLSGIHTAAIKSEPAHAHNSLLSHPARDSWINDPSPDASFNSNQRSIFEIVWGCLTTIFLCTWVAVHPDIPKADQSDWNVLCHRLKMMCWTIMFPELVITHAVRQFREARSCYRSYKSEDSGWTMKHAHFKRMGGFRDVGHLTSEQMPAAGIQDKSKADGLSKIILVTQSLWFVAQCIGRRVKGLDLSPLEVTTLALTVCTFMLSIIWWDKPFDVRKPIIRLDGALRLATFQNSSTLYVGQNETTSSNPGVILEVDITEGEFSYIVKPKEGWGVAIRSNDDSWRSKSDTPPDDGLSRSPPQLENPIRDTIDSDDDWMRSTSHETPEYEGSDWETTRVSLVVFLFFTMTLPFSTVSGFTLLFEGVTDDDLYYRGPNVVSILQRFRIPVTGAMILGMVHCISWNSYFPSTKEKTLWRISSVAISALMLATACAYRSAYRPAYRSTKYNSHYTNSQYLGFGLMRFLAIIYIVARCYLLTEGLLALRDLPPSALETFNWSDFLPHVS